jgi:AcrR family transcriptional regulator
MTQPKDDALANRKGEEIQQERARATREKLIRGASTMFWTKGYHNAQTPEIAAAAGVSVGTFYRYFSDKRDVLLEIARRELGEAHQEVLALLTPERFVGKGRRNAITAVIHILIGAVAKHPERHKLFVEMALRDDDFAAIKHPFDEETRRVMAQILSAVSSRELVPDPEAAAFILHTALTECALRLAGVRGQQPVSRERAIAALAAIVEQALFGTDE